MGNKRYVSRKKGGMMEEVLNEKVSKFQIQLQWVLSAVISGN